MTHRLRPTISWTVLILAGTADLFILAIQWWINTARLARQSPPLLEFSLAQVGTLLAVQVAVFLGIWWMLRRGPDRMLRLAHFVALSLFVVLVVRVAILVTSYRAPMDRARVAMTSAHVRSAESKVIDYWTRTGRLPADLSEANVEPTEASDAWGFKLRYDIDPDGHGFKIAAIGVPERARRGLEDRIKLEVIRRVTTSELGPTSPSTRSYRNAEAGCLPAGLSCSG